MKLKVIFLLICESSKYIAKLFSLSIVLKNGLNVLPETIDKIRNCQKPTNDKQVRSALGMMGYNRKFILGYAKIVQPLNYLLKKDTKFALSEKCDSAFNELKDRLTKALWVGIGNMFEHGFI